MFSRLSKMFFLPPVLFAFLGYGCAFADLRPIEMSTVPEAPWALLPDAESPAVIRFDTEMEKSSVEKAFQIFSPAGVVDGELCWKGKALYFFSSVPWKPGIRYVLRLSGTVFARDGRELPLSGDIPFYAVSRSSLPYVEKFSPPDGASVGAAASPILELNFSHPMDRLSTEDALKIDIPGEKIFEWLDNDKTLRLISDKPLNPWIVYRWSISENAQSAEGAPIAKEFHGRFVTDLDRDFLKVVRLVPLMPPEFSRPAQRSALWGQWVPSGTGLERGPGSGQGIGVEFSKPPDSTSLRRAFSFTPSLPGRVEVLSPLSAVFIPSKDPDPETVYNLRISGSLKDCEGLKMGEDFTTTFTSDIPYLEILSVSFGQDGEKTAPESGSLVSAPVTTGGIVRCYIYFSLPFEPEKPEAREECVFKISLNPFFPGTLLPVNLRSAGWLSSDRLFLEWEGAEAGQPDEPFYYKLVIPGGPGGAHNGHGSYLKENFYLYVEANND